MRTKLLIFIILYSFNNPVFAINNTCFNNLISTSISSQQVFYKNGVLHLDGFNETGLINIYSIIGNKVFSSEKINLTLSKSLTVSLKTGNMYIIQIHLNNSIQTFKIIA